MVIYGLNVIRSMSRSVNIQKHCLVVIVFGKLTIFVLWPVRLGTTITYFSGFVKATTVTRVERLLGAAHNTLVQRVANNTPSDSDKKVTPIYSFVF
ncbi:hypothetical protein Hanom_Chr02g00116311 [Helianthus anomalus]